MNFTSTFPGKERGRITIDEDLEKYDFVYVIMCVQVHGNVYI